MEEILLNAVANQGVWAVMFVAMLFYVLRTNDKREDKYQDIIDSLTEHFGIVEDVQRDVRKIKEKIFK